MAKKEKKIQIIFSFRSYPMASFKAKIRGETPRNGENKNYRSVPFQPDG